jgi:uncharacterized protein YdeI (YjbR/CyaY-like superfamily)
MGQFGRIQSLSDLPSEKRFAKYIRKAMKLIEEGVKRPIKTKPDLARELLVPDYFLKELKKKKKALHTFNNFPYGHRKEYVQWISEAKTEVTRNKRIQTALEWLIEGKDRNWKYKK